MYRFYVNLNTKESTWDRPTSPAHPPTNTAPSGPPPTYSSGPYAPKETGDSKTSHFESNNPYNQHASGGPTHTEDDAALAARLQAEEDARARGHDPNAGAANSYYQGSNPTPTPQDPYYQQQQERGGGKKSGGFLGKLLSKASGGKTSGGYGHAAPYGQQGYAGYPPQQGQYGQGYPPQGYPPQGYPPQGPGYGYPPQQMYGQGGKKPGRGGLGAGGGAALGLGAGLLGGAVLADAMDDHEEHEAYDQGYDDGADGGGDFGGGDF